jgi:predicted GH43/DUF377 family glycosyl hydrolase
MRSYDPGNIGCYAGWRRYEGNPIIDERIGDSSDPVVIPHADGYKMFYTHRFLRKILTAKGEDALEFRPFAVGAVPKEGDENADDVNMKSYRVGQEFYSDGGDFAYSLSRRPHLGWETAVCQPCVLKMDNIYHLWYTGKHYEDSRKAYTAGVIGHGISKNAHNWKAGSEPVLVPDQLWEADSVQYPSVMWDEDAKLFKMWYSAGDVDDPASIGYAESSDGLVWKKFTEPVFTRLKDTVLERERVYGCHVIKEKGWYIMFYTAVQDHNKERICLARSRDGITGWERHPSNPIITWGQFGAWDVESVSIPFPLHLAGRWLCYYTGRNFSNHRIGVLIHDGDDLGFDTRR